MGTDQRDRLRSEEEAGEGGILEAQENYSWAEQVETQEKYCRAEPMETQENYCWVESVRAGDHPLQTHTHTNVHRVQEQLTLFGGSVDGAPIYSLIRHDNPLVERGMGVGVLSWIDQAPPSLQHSIPNLQSTNHQRLFSISTTISHCI